MDVFMYIRLGMVLDGNIGVWVLKFKIHIYGLNQAISNWFDPLKLVYKGGFTINIWLTLVCFTEKLSYFNLC